MLDMLKEGFDVHHVDGDHGNNTPLNLVLIEAVDHMRLHGMNLKDGIQGWRRKLQEKSMRARAKRKELPVAANAAPAAVVVVEEVVPEPIPYVDGARHSGLNEMDVRAYQSRINGLAA